MNSAVITVYGNPAPKGSRTVGQRKNGTLYTRPANPREKAWEALVRTAAADLTTLEPPYEVNIKFRFTKPQKPSHPYPSRNDLDKLCRCLLDGLIGNVIVDDRHIVRLVAQKEWGTEGAVVIVRSLAPAQ